jgi:SNF2 family DNA or RNA helicase
MTATVSVRPWWRHQQQALDFSEVLWQRHRRALMLAICMGGGKSRLAIEITRRRLQSALAGGEPWRAALILCPLRVVEVWRRQFAEYAPEFEFLGLNESAGPVRAKMHAARQRLEWASSHARPLVIAVNYESARSEPFAAWALGQMWGMVVADESHRLAGPSARTSRWCARLGMRARARLALTGTPFCHSPLSIWGQFRFLDPCLYEPTYGQFERHYARMGGYRDHEVIGWQDLETLERIFRLIAFRVDERVLDLPAELDETLEADLSPQAASIYAAMEEDMVAKIGTGEVTAANALVRLLRLQQITGGTLADDGGHEHLIDNAKENLLADLLEDLDEPVVVFARFRADLEAIHRAAIVTGRKSGELSGDRARAGDLAAWQRGSTDDPVVLAAQIQAGGVGVDLTRARIAIYFSLGFSLTDWQQSRARIRRPPQRRACVFYNLQIRNSIDQYVLEAIGRRHDLVDSVLDHLREKGAHHGRPGR